jgi:hypothetical protein
MFQFTDIQMRKAGFLLSIFFLTGFCSMAQTNSLTGKWKIIRITDGTMEVDLKDTTHIQEKMFESAKKTDKDWTSEDSLMVLFAGKMMINLFYGAVMEFKGDSTYIFTTNATMGGKKKAPEEGKYLIDQANSLVVTTRNEKQIRHRYEFKGDLLYLSIVRQQEGKKDLTQVLEKVE